MIALVLVTRSQQLAPSSPARAPRPSEVSDPIVTIDTSKMTLALEAAKLMHSWGFALREGVFAETKCAAASA